LVDYNGDREENEDGRMNEDYIGEEDEDYNMKRMNIDYNMKRMNIDYNMKIGERMKMEIIYCIKYAHYVIVYFYQSMY